VRTAPKSLTISTFHWPGVFEQKYHPVSVDAVRLCINKDRGDLQFGLLCVTTDTGEERGVCPRIWRLSKCSDMLTMEKFFL